MAEPRRADPPPVAETDAEPTAGLAAGGPVPEPGHAADEVLASRFRIRRMLGQGGMGQVFEADDLELRERVAVKVLRPDMAADAGAQERFRREISLARRVTHPNACRIFDLFLHRPPGTTPPVALISMELLGGETLAQHIRRRGPMQPAAALVVARQIAAALEAAHRAGVVHRDLKPSNVVLVGEGVAQRVVVTDFGLAAAAGHGDDTGTEPLLRGTAAYMAPEQVDGVATTPATDVYSFGITLYEMVTGTVPFSGSSPLSTALQRLRVPPVAPRVHRPDLDPQWERVILRCLERSPSDRPAGPMLVVDALEPGGTLTVRRRSRSLVAAGAVLALALAGALPWLWRSSSAPAGPVAGRPRPMVALLGFRNLAARPDAEWLGGAVAEMLGVELSAGESLRLASGEDVARLRARLDLPEADSLARDTLERVHRTLGADYVVLGTYVALGPNAGGQLRLDVRVQDATSGETVAVVSETGTEAGVLDLVSRAGAALRRRLGAGALTGAQAAEARASQPDTPEAARHYADGLARLRLFDAAGARASLELAIVADPDHPLPHAAKAEALARLGHDEEAVAAARRARELSAKLPRAERLRLAGVEHETGRALPKAIEAYRVLWGFFPDDLEHGLRLARALTAAGRGEEALEVIATLRRTVPPEVADHRLELAEAEADLSRSDFAGALEAARRASRSGQAIDAVHVVARAALDEGAALWGRGEQHAAGAAFARARELFAEIGDRSGVANATNRMAGVPYERGEFREAETMFEEALALCRQIGDLRCIGRQLGNIAEARASRGELAGALPVYEEALALNRRNDNGAPLADNLIGLGKAHLARGDLAEAERLLAEALATARRIGDRRHAGYALHAIGQLRLVSGDVAGARRRHEEALALRTEMNQSDTVAASRLALAAVAVAEGHAADADRLAASALAEFRREGFADYQAEALATRARSLQARGDAAAARAAADEALGLAVRSQNPQVKLRVLADVVGAGVRPAIAGEWLAEGRRLGLNTWVRQVERAQAPARP